MKTYTPPANTRLYVVGDIHGRADLLQLLHQKIIHDAATAGKKTLHLVYLGDYIDRGSLSRQVITTLLKPSPIKARRHFLLGNHEQAMLDFLDDPEPASAWLSWGGMATLHSYGITPTKKELSEQGGLRQLAKKLARALPATHLKFLKNCRLSTRLGDILCVHAGINPSLPLNAQPEQTLLTTRQPFINDPADYGVRVIFGHTVQEAPLVMDNKIGIDTGAYATGTLTCAVLEGSSVRFIQT